MICSYKYMKSYVFCTKVSPAKFMSLFQPKTLLVSSRPRIKEKGVSRPCPHQIFEMFK